MNDKTRSIVKTLAPYLFNLIWGACYFLGTLIIILGLKDLCNSLLEGYLYGIPTLLAFNVGWGQVMLLVHKHLEASE